MFFFLWFYQNRLLFTVLYPIMRNGSLKMCGFIWQNDTTAFKLCMLLLRGIVRILDAIKETEWKSSENITPFIINFSSVSAWKLNTASLKMLLNFTIRSLIDNLASFAKTKDSKGYYNISKTKLWRHSVKLQANHKFLWMDWNF